MQCQLQRLKVAKMQTQVRYFPDLLREVATHQEL